MNSPHPQSRRVLRWVFERHNDAITCEIDAAGDHVFEVCIVPHWNVAASTIERYDAAYRAFERHAELARRLREAGWLRASARAHRPDVAAA
jgi:hypothetical protein